MHRHTWLHHNQMLNVCNCSQVSQGALQFKEKSKGQLYCLICYNLVKHGQHNPWCSSTVTEINSNILYQVALFKETQTVKF